MNCPRCGYPNQSYAPHCSRCNQDLSGYSAEMRMLLPVGRSGLAIIAGYLGLLSLFSPAGPLAILFAILALRDLQAHPEKHGMGRVVFAFIAGGLSTLVLLAIIVLSLTPR